MGWLQRLFGRRVDGREAKPVDGWNDFIDRYCTRYPDEVEPEFLPAFLVFRYYSEVYNGGHLQFFLNCDYLQFETVSAALAEVAGPDAAGNFDAAVAVWKSRKPAPPETSREFVELAREQSFEEHDRFIYLFEPDFDRLLETYLIERKLI